MKVSELEGRSESRRVEGLSHLEHLNEGHAQQQDSRVAEDQAS